MDQVLCADFIFYLKLNLPLLLNYFYKLLTSFIPSLQRMSLHAASFSVLFFVRTNTKTRNQ